MVTVCVLCGVGYIVGSVDWLIGLGEVGWVVLGKIVSACVCMGSVSGKDAEDFVDWDNGWSGDSVWGEVVLKILLEIVFEEIEWVGIVPK